MSNASAANLTLQDFGVKGEGAPPPQVTFAVSQEDSLGASSGLSWDRCVTPQPYTSRRGTPTPDKPRT